MARAIAFLLLFFSCTIPAIAGKRVGVGEFKQALAEMRNKSDAEQAWQIAGLELTERLSPTSLSRIQDNLPGEKSRRALLALADQAAFLELPAAELPSNPAPDFAEQRRIMGLAVSYVRDAIPRLPNFFATRATNRYEDTPQVETLSGLVPYQPMHFVDRAESTVLYREGREVVETATGKGGKAPMQGLMTWGVFGPILSTVLLDAAHSKLTWGHWEPGTAGPAAVFSFTVPKERSHYEINYCCIANQSATEVAHLQPFRQLVGYHGEMTIDPDDGTILRITVVADLKATDPVVKAAIVVEYNSVEIAGKSYLCPVRSVSDTVAQSLQHDPRYSFALARQIQPLMTSVNEVAFENYHVFRTDTRVLTPEEAALAQAASATLPPSASPNQPEPADEPKAVAANGAPPASSAHPEAAPVAEPKAPVEAAVPEIEMVPDAALADTRNNGAQSSERSSFTVRTTTRLVDLALVADDKKGHPVTDLKPEDLEIYDNGRRQEIKFFSHASAESRLTGAGPTQTTGPTQRESYTNRPSSTLPLAPTETSTILMIDAAHVAFGDLTYAREEILRFLKTVPPDETAGLYILKSYGYEVLTEPTLDHARLASLLNNWMPSAQDLAHAQDEEQRNRQHFDWVHNNEDVGFVNGNSQGGSDPETSNSGGAVAFAAGSAPDAALRPLGDRPAEFALHLLVGVGRHLAAIPGHKVLVWISSDNVLADFSAQSVGHGDTGTSDTHFLSETALRTRETLNDAHVSIYPLDASQLEAGGVSADIGTRNVLPVGMSDRDSRLTGDTAPGMKPGRATAQMQQDTHPIQGTFRELAAATGGRAMQRAGDIAAELNSVVADGRAAYMLSFSPDVPTDDKYHVITVKLAEHRQLNLRYRSGYFYAAEPTTIKDHFRQSVWDPQDANEIAITATPVFDAKGVRVKLNIDATQLGLAQNADRWTDQLGVFLALRDDSGLHAKVTGRSLMLRLLPGTYQQVLKDGIPIEQSIDTGATFDSVRLIVVDENSGRIGSVTIPLALLRRPT